MILIVVGGDRVPEELLRQAALKAEMVIAADRGAWYCLQAGIIPDLVVGDMDSIPEEALEELQAGKVTILTFSPYKDKTDTQIALEVALKRGAREIEILSGIGSRFDHSLANVHLLHLALKAGLRARIVSERQIIFLIEGECTLTNEEGTTISFLPLGMMASGITLKGFAYELDDATMEIGLPWGVSNVITDQHALVRVREGILIAVLVKKE
jgi:thiamine pyrophosphokinase